MTEDVRRHRHRAKRLLDSVVLRWQDELPEVVCHTAYYAMYPAAFALFAARGLALPKTHHGVNVRFSENFRQVQPDGREQLGRLARALDRRLIADYDAVDTLTTDDARHARDDAMSFIAFCERLIDRSS
ncbi:MAG: HEPN domain-containing protein [Reyranellaceae bacterium]